MSRSRVPSRTFDFEKVARFAAGLCETYPMLEDFMADEDLGPLGWIDRRQACVDQLIAQFGETEPYGIVGIAEIVRYGTEEASSARRTFEMWLCHQISEYGYVVRVDRRVPASV